MRKVERDLTCTQAALAIDSAPADANERLTASVIVVVVVFIGEDVFHVGCNWRGSSDRLRLRCLVVGTSSMIFAYSDAGIVAARLDDVDICLGLCFLSKYLFQTVRIKTSTMARELEMDERLMNFVNLLGVVIFFLITAFHFLQSSHKNSKATGR